MPTTTSERTERPTTVFIRPLGGRATLVPRSYQENGIPRLILFRYTRRARTAQQASARRYFRNTGDTSSA